MPAFATHYLFAADMLPYLKSAMDFEINENALFIGAQGPDIFFFHRALPFWWGKPLRKAGSAVHRAAFGSVLDEMTEYCKTSKRPGIAKSYVCGFILHYALDRCAHPYIYFRQNLLTAAAKPKNPPSAHNTVELSIDSVMLNEKLGVKKPRGFNTKNMFCCNDFELSEIAGAAAAFSKVIAPLHFDVNDVKTAVKDTRRAQGVLADKTGLKKAAAAAVQTLAAPFSGGFMLSAMFRTNNLTKARGFMNYERRRWESPFAQNEKRKKSSESFLDLYEYAKKDAAQMLDAWRGGLPGEQITNNISFLTGLKTEEQSK
ncbi:MAG: zinc dependent phospholipase C family protein [Clostridiales bacterium]|nr:zinc dependent phospholipase C family protein [Clostridiales bacterium]